MTTPMYSLSICGQATLNLHALNNEGGEGNQVQTRMVDIVGQDGRLYNVNAISGDMFKHIQAGHLHRLGLQGDFPMSEAARQFNANRITADPEFRDYIKQKTAPTAVQILDYIIDRCAISSMEGVLVTEAKNSAPRKSVVEFGWVVGVPDVTRTEQYFHAKYVPDKREKPDDKDDREGNLGQNIFHRPASSGQYAVVVQTELSRIGYNDISQQYKLDEAARLARHKALLESLIYTFVQPNGAMRSTQMPHLVNFRGAVTYTSQIVPAPAISSLNRDFVVELEQVASELNQLRPGAVIVEKFETLAEFTKVMTRLINTTSPYRLEIKEQQHG